MMRNDPGPSSPARRSHRDLVARLAEAQQLLEQDQFVEALPRLYALRAEAERAGLPAEAARACVWIAAAHLRLGQVETAESLLWELFAKPGVLGDDLRMEALLLRAEAAIRSGQTELAERLLPEAVERAQPLSTKISERLTLLQADLFLASGHASEAWQLLRSQAPLAGSSPDRAAQAALRHARAKWALGRRTEAVRELLEAHTALEEHLAPDAPSLLRAELLLLLGIYSGELAAVPQSDLEVPELSPAAHYLARAQEQFAACGSLSGLDRVRRQFQRYGRRASDQVVDADLAREADALAEVQRNLARQLDRLLPLAAQAAGPPPAPGGSPEAPITATYRAIHQALVALDRRLDRLLTAARGTVVERDRLHVVLDGLRRLTSVDLDAESLIRQVLDLALTVVAAERGVLALVSRSGELRPREVRHIDPAAAAWRRVSERACDAGQPFAVSHTGDLVSLSDARPQVASAVGTALAVPIRRGEQTLGVLYVDRIPQGGQLSRRDLTLLEVIAAQVGTLLERQRMTWSLHMAARLRETTMEAISDGVLAISSSGTIRSANSHACHLLRQDRAHLEGRRLAEVGGLGSIFADLSRLPDLDGQVVRLPGGEVVLGVRPIRDDTGEQAGYVLTCTAMKRAQRTAQRIVGARARYTFDDILGAAPVFTEQVRLAQAAAQSDSGVLITGESGTGKEVLAQAIHNGSRRRDEPFVGINCAAIPRDLLESELFGHEEGAFTGSRRGGQPGKFELAQGGTVLLDEIGDMPLEMQAKLLRVLQERRFQRVGGSREYLLRARIIATTNQDLEQLAAEQRFRSDLLFRLQVIHLQLPPLRERKEDIPRFVEHFLRRAAKRLGKQVTRVAPEVMEAFVDYAWPGNVRELEYVVESEVNLVPAEAEVLDRIPRVLRPSRRRRRETLVGLRAAGAEQARAPSGSMNLQDVEREVLIAALREHRGSVPAVAKALGVSRGTIYNKARRYDLDLQAFRRTR